MAVDLTITVANEPGALADVAQQLAVAGINIESVFCDAAGVETDLHVLVEDPVAAREALRGTDAAILAEREVVVVDAEDRPGMLAELATRVAEANVNVDLIYVATDTRVVLASGDLDALRAAVD